MNPNSSSCKRIKHNNSIWKKCSNCVIGNPSTRANYNNNKEMKHKSREPSECNLLTSSGWSEHNVTISTPPSQNPWDKRRQKITTIISQYRIKFFWRRQTHCKTQWILWMWGEKGKKKICCSNGRHTVFTVYRYSKKHRIHRCRKSMNRIEFFQ